ncbi:MAG: hypothetical protein ACO1RT_05955 [Planctomycetaceae bacterium]
MHCVELAELASLLSRQAAALLLLRPTIAQDSLTRYWVQSRQRIESWHRAMAEYLALENAGRPLAMQTWWSDHQSMLEDVIVSESLTRVFAAIGMGLDAAANQQEVEPVTHSVFLSHLEARNRVLQLLLFGRGESVSQATSLNRLRRASERWTDRLLAPVIAVHRAAVAYAIDPQRAIAYVHELREVQSPAAQSVACWLAQLAMRTTLAERTSRRPGLPGSNREVAYSVLACLESECFDSCGLLKSLNAARMERAAADRQPHSSEPLFPSVMPNDHRSGSYPHAARWLH